MRVVFDARFDCTVFASVPRPRLYRAGVDVEPYESGSIVHREAPSMNAAWPPLARHRYRRPNPRICMQEGLPIFMSCSYRLWTRSAFKVRKEYYVTCVLLFRVRACVLRCPDRACGFTASTVAATRFGSKCGNFFRFPGGCLCLGKQGMAKCPVISLLPETCRPTTLVAARCLA